MVGGWCDQLRTAAAMLYFTLYTSLFQIIFLSEIKNLSCKMYTANKKRGGELLHGDK